MNRSSRSVTNSLKGRVWLAAIALAIVNCICGLGSYLTLSFLSADPLFTVVATIFLLALITLVFGWWLSTDLLKPIDTVTLLARSLERSPSATLPRTTGAVETDQLLQTLHRSGQQLQNLIALMDDVAAGKVEAAMMPLESSDKLSASFQKLVSRVTDSISAKNDLDEIRGALATLSKEVSGVRNGRLDLNLQTDNVHTRELADALKFLSTRLSGVTQQIYATTSECERAATETRSSIQSTIEAIDERSSVIARNGSAVSADPRRADALLADLSRTVLGATAAYDRYATETSGSARLSDSASQLRATVAETAKSVQKLRNRTAMVSQAARVAQELAKRSNLLALNAGIAANGLPATQLISTEIEALSKKSDELQKQLVSVGEGLNSEIAGIEKELSSLTDLAPDLSRAVNASVQVNHTLCEQLVKIGELEEGIRSAFDESRLDCERLQGVLEKVADVSLASAMVRETETEVQRFSTLLDGLRDSVADLKLSGSAMLRNSDPPLRSSFEVPTATPSFDTRENLGSASGFQAEVITEGSIVFETKSGFETLAGFEAKTGFETVTGFETLASFEPVTGTDAGIGES